MATGAEGLFVQPLTGYLWLTWEPQLRAMVHELFKFILGDMNRLFPSGLSCASLPDVITQMIAATAAQVMYLCVVHSPLY